MKFLILIYLRLPQKHLSLLRPYTPALLIFNLILLNTAASFFRIYSITYVINGY